MTDERLAPLEFAIMSCNLSPDNDSDYGHWFGLRHYVRYAERVAAGLPADLRADGAKMLEPVRARLKAVEVENRRQAEMRNRPHPWPVDGVYR